MNPSSSTQAREAFPNAGHPAGRLRTFGKVASTEPKYFGVGAGIAVRKEDTELLAKLNKAIDAILRNGVYKAINDKYFDFNVYGEPLPQ